VGRRLHGARAELATRHVAEEALLRLQMASIARQVTKCTYLVFTAKTYTDSPLHDTKPALLNVVVDPAVDR
jgi:hypothetical protein